jgi:predicted ATPase/DNA-binding winged helix-turn-helix (wHTH) protein
LAPEPLVFQGWELDALARELRIEGQPVRLGDRAFDLLSALAARAGQVVGKNELLDRVWPGRVVEENNLSVQIAALRRVLGADTVQNVAGVGYRLAALPMAAAAPTPQRAADTQRSSHADPAAGPHRHAMPATLVGRDDDLGQLRRLVAQAALVTITGTGGVGKTTLARALLQGLAPPPDGLHWLDLAPLRPGTALLPLVARALGLMSPVEAAPDDTARALSACDALVVLDNCEHLADEVAALLAPLLVLAPRLRWLATSQEALRLVGEVVHRLGPLSVPDAGQPPTAPGASAALALLCRRIDAAGTGPAWTPDALAVAADLCRRLDGLPLALEIAAARVATLGLEGVRRQLDQRLRMRTALRSAPSRQHSLLQTYEWSYSLLSPQEQRVFCSLQPFAGGFTAELLQRVHRHLDAPAADTGWEALDALQALVDKSLVQTGPAEAGGAPRLWLLESARDFARLQLEATGQAEAVCRAHAHALADWMDLARSEHDRLRDRDWNLRHVPERRNVQVALAWACGHDDADLLARLVAALGLIETFTQTASDLVAMPVPMALLRQASPARRALALLELGWAHHLDGSGEEATALSLQALADFEALGDDAGAYVTLTRLIRLYHGRSGQQAESRQMWLRLQAIDTACVPLRARLNFESSSSYLVGAPRSLERQRELQGLAERAGFDDITAICQVNVTDELMVQGRDEEVVAEALALLRRGMALPRRRALVSHNLALSLVRLGRVDEAREHARAVSRALPSQAHLVLDLFAFAAARAGRLEDAALVAGHSALIRRRRDVHPEVCEAALIEQTWQWLQGLAAPRRAELVSAGEALALEDALHLALGTAER